MGRLLIAVLVCGLVFAGHATAQTGSEPVLIEPSIAPDGSQIAFASGGDTRHARRQLIIYRAFFESKK
jgi:Tol biopolymer transport system component